VRAIPTGVPSSASATSAVFLAHRDDDALVLVAVLDDAGGTGDWSITIDDVLADLAP
jgi:hypothetical protein